ncbi:MAG: outer membrane protein assembly factor BamC [Brachymonas sp.]|nr:outer membrane protein assembly factor BamC [Brachymonas sp.]
MNALRKLSLLGLAAALTACTATSGGGIDYRSARRGNPLEVPPDLTRLSSDGRYNVPGSASAVDYASDKKTEGQSVATALTAVGDVQIKRDGNQRWLVVQRTPAELWEPVKAFWEDNGFVLAVEDRKIGVMETDWAENRANIPLDPIRAALGRALDSLYSTGQLDRFRTRLEANASGGTDIFVSQRGMEEVYTSRDKSTTAWQPRANDPALEDEFLRRMMVALGVPAERASALIKQSQAAGQAGGAAAAQTTAQAGVQYNEAAQALVLADNFDRAWRRVGLSLDRSGFTVEDRDRSAAVYYVRYVPFVPEKKEPTGWFKRMFRKTPEVKAVRYRVQLQNQGAGTAVRVQMENGQPASAGDSARILKLLAEDLRRS